ncbi:MAG: complement resistance protein TraT [Phycisphaerales bacterium JB064]
MQTPLRKTALAAALIGGILLASTLTGCTAAARGMGRITANKYASAQSGTVWVVPPPQLEPPAPENKKVYVSFQNISDADVDLTQLLRDAATSQGWQLVSNPQEATYRLRARTRFFGEVEPETGGADTARAMGWISGAAVGLGTYALVENATDSWAAGAGAGAAAGGLVGLGMTNASKVREWAMITDFVLEEYSPEPIEFELLADSDTSGSTTAGVGSSRMGEGGATSQRTGSTATMTRTSNYFPHGVRLSAWANQMNMKEDEAMPLIRERVERIVQQMLPQ